MEKEGLFSGVAATDSSGREPNVYGHLKSVENCFTNRYLAREKSLCRPMARLKPVFFTVFLAMAGMVFCMQNAKAQVKLLTNGNVGIGTNSPYAKFQVNTGTTCITLSPSSEPDIGGYNGKSGDTRINFWHPISKYNKLRIKGYVLSSDSTLKTDIVPMENATNILKQIKTYSYYYKSDCVDERQKDYGILAQEIEEILPELIDTAKETMLVNYNAFFAFLIKGFNEQQTVIEQLQTEVEILQDIVVGQELDLTVLYELQDEVGELRYIVNTLQKNCCKDIIIPPYDRDSNHNKQSQIKDEAILYQNTPNPFSSNTEIYCYVPVINTNAFIYIYNLQGVELMSFPIVQTGYSTVYVYASALPAGMYLYTLVVDGVIIDTKRMILTK